MAEWKNDTVIEHISSHGTRFLAENGDLRTGVKVSSEWEIKPKHLLEDFAEWGAWHAMHIHPHLNGFSGYDAITYDYDELQEDD